MALKKGEKAPDFTLPSTTGEKFTLSKDRAGKATVLYFYPKDFTRVCTEEACEFRDAFEDFKDLGVDVIGISRDTVDTHHKFKEKHDLPFELLADVQGAVAKKYKASMPILSMSKRITYLLDENHVVKAVIENMFSAKKHLKEMLKGATDLEFQPEMVGRK
ncbi:MAG TPA: peroxiredoxin [Cytophagales bacterium]|nr:peroxiredoxin [Cytophagales bacterium]HAP61970.1 peroxiredoxin [Cytophagales bacterium]